MSVPVRRGFVRSGSRESGHVPQSQGYVVEYHAAWPATGGRSDCESKGMTWPLREIRTCDARIRRCPGAILAASSWSAARTPMSWAGRSRRWSRTTPTRATRESARAAWAATSPRTSRGSASDVDLITAFGGDHNAARSPRSAAGSESESLTPWTRPTCQDRSISPCSTRAATWLSPSTTSACSSGSRRRTRATRRGLLGGGVGRRGGCESLGRGDRMARGPRGSADPARPRVCREGAARRRGARAGLRC